jgi:rubrerythrin
MKSVRGSRTELNLMAAFAGESQARNRYTYFASKAKEDGFIQISMIFEETASQEKEHAKRLFKFMEGGETSITGTFPSGVIGTTRDNLFAAAAGENHEWKSMYPDFADIAVEEGYSAIATVFRSIAVAERQHAKRYEKLASNIDADAVFKSDVPLVWRCLNCGYLYEGSSAPQTCPACAHPQAYFERLAENY